MAFEYISEAHFKILFGYYDLSSIANKMYEHLNKREYELFNKIKEPFKTQGNVYNGMAYSALRRYCLKKHEVLDLLFEELKKNEQKAKKEIFHRMQMAIATYHLFFNKVINGYSWILEEDPIQLAELSAYYEVWQKLNGIHMVRRRNIPFTLFRFAMHYYIETELFLPCRHKWTRYQKIEHFEKVFPDSKYKTFDRYFLRIKKAFERGDETAIINSFKKKHIIMFFPPRQQTEVSRFLDDSGIF